MQKNYEKLMRKCITLAKKGRGKTSPNPMVGCVVLDKNGNLISVGYHHKYGKNHAERDALLKLKNGEEKDGVLIVNLEPCSHYGKTPPCADLIIERGIKKVVIGCVDNNPKVNGGGIKKLKSAGVKVITGVLERECRELNEIFFTNVEQNRTFVALKTATTTDGKISTYSADSKWITSEKSRNYGRKLRTYYDAILTSSNTVLADNPTMKHKIKIILDRHFRTNFSYNIYKDGRVLLVTEKTPQNIPSNVKIINCPVKNDKVDLRQLLNELYKLGINSIFVECGGRLNGSFIEGDLVDKIYHFIAPKILNDNNGISCFSGEKKEKITECKQYAIQSVKKLGCDVLITYSNSK